MLIKFTFSNFKSFKDETVFDMTASTIKQHPYNLTKTGGKSSYLRVAAIYGSNASGKSNFIKGFEFMRFYTLKSLLISEDERQIELLNNVKVPKFVFDKESIHDNSEFEVVLKYGDNTYKYGFSLDNSIVKNEWLYLKKEKRSDYYILFEREGNDIKCGPKMEEAKKFKDSVESNVLFLSLTAKTKVTHSINVRNWFLKCQVVNFGSVNFEQFISSKIPTSLVNDEKYKQELQKFINAIDVGIQSIEIETVEKDNGEAKYKPYAIHGYTGDSETHNIKLPLEQESSGTLKMFLLFDFFWKSMKQGTPIFIDELNAKLHPLLVKYIINMFHDDSINVNNAQLIYTTHDIFTLKKEIFRRDEIWFTEKNNNGISEMFSLIDLEDDDKKIRSDATFDKEYISGRYGAVPILKEFNFQ